MFDHDKSPRQTLVAVVGAILFSAASISLGLAPVMAAEASASKAVHYVVAVDVPA
jgi:hypothetical protein